jgi:hypothetical protein
VILSLTLAATIVICAPSGTIRADEPSAPAQQTGDDDLTDAKVEAAPPPRSDPAKPADQPLSTPMTLIGPPPVTFQCAPQSMPLAGPLAPTRAFIESMPLTAAWAEIQLPPSSQRQYFHVVDHQIDVPRPQSATVVPQTQGTTFLLRTLDPRFDDAPTPAGYTVLSVLGTARGDVIIDTTRLKTSTFLPVNIPVNGDAFFGSGQRLSLATSGVGTRLIFNTATNTGLNSYTALDHVKVFADVQFAMSLDGEQRASVPNFYGQFANLIIGSAVTIFSDPDSIPDTIDPSGANAVVDRNHVLIGCFLPYSDRLYAVVSMEAPEASVAAPPTNKSFTGTSFSSFSHIPDFAAKLRWEDKVLGHVQFATILRDIAIENNPYTAHKDVFGWGVHLSSTWYPFSDNLRLQADHINFGVIYGEGIGNYNIDVDKAFPSGGSDAAFDANNNLKALPFFSGFVGYSHCWTDNLTSTVVYSQVELDSLPSQGAMAYRRGRFIAANLVYHWALPTAPAAYSAGTADTPLPYLGFAGLEYLYGSRDTLGGNHGEDHRVALTVGVKH